VGYPKLAILALAALTAIGTAAEQSEPEKLIEAGHWKKARAIVEARLHANPQDALATFLLSQIHNAFGDHESPLPLAEKAIALDGSQAKFHRQFAEALGVKAQHAGVFQQVMLAHRFKKEIDKAIELDPHDTQALRDLMEYYLLAPGIAGGDKGKAQATAGQIARIEAGEGFSAQARLASFNGDRGQAEALLRKAVEAAPANYRARIALATFDITPGHTNPEVAEAQARQALKIDPQRADAYAILAKIYATRSHWTELDSILSTAEKEVPDDLVPYYRASEALLESGNAFDRAARYLRKYVAVEPEGNAPSLSEGHWKLGLALEKMGKGSEALAEWRESVRLDRNSPALHDLKRLQAHS
jgi:tetratricopeptide (TPR) repeat protein